MSGTQPSRWPASCPTCSSATPWIWAHCWPKRRWSRPGSPWLVMMMVFWKCVLAVVLRNQRGVVLWLKARTNDSGYSDEIHFWRNQSFQVFWRPHRLECDQECATLERNRRLAEALQINSASDPFNVRATSVYSDGLKEDARSVFSLYLLHPCCSVCKLMCIARLPSCVTGKTWSLSLRLKERSGTSWNLPTRWFGQALWCSAPSGGVKKILPPRSGSCASLHSVETPAYHYCVFCRKLWKYHFYFVKHCPGNAAIGLLPHWFLSNWYSNTCVLRGNSQREATVSQPWTENTAGSSTSWPRSTAWRAWATTANPNATWSSQPRSRTALKMARPLNCCWGFFWMKHHPNNKWWSSGERQPVQAQHWHRWLSARRPPEPRLPLLTSNSRAASKYCEPDQPQPNRTHIVITT